jgi:hypothetical protein
MKNLFLANTRLRINTSAPEGETVELLGEEFYKLAHYDRLRPFFMSIVSDTDHWMFISSTGGLTAGRGNPDHALFPYCTDDKIHESSEITGSKTIIRVETKGREFVWEPFSERNRGIYRVGRSLYKSYRANKLVFEEINTDLGLRFSYGWFNSGRFGFVRRCWLENQQSERVLITFLDGVQNLMPSGIGTRFQLEKSTLLDAYKKNELIAAVGLGLFRLSSIPVDRPEPAEALRTTIAWCSGLDTDKRLLCSRQLNAFRQGQPVQHETDVRAERGAYFVEARIMLSPQQTQEWMIVADVDQSSSDVADLARLLSAENHVATGKSRKVPRARARSQPSACQLVLDDIARGTDALVALVASADGLQKTSHPVSDARHFCNVLFNVMRGGVFLRNHLVDTEDLQRFVRQSNPGLARRHASFFRKLAEQGRLATGFAADASSAPRVSLGAMMGLAAETEEVNLERLCREYLPLTFSRRHGDPSRPWNQFSIPTRNLDGTPRLEYEGNWRDIFQNWEALATSFPGYVASMVCRFVNASTADGYNPYRISRSGIDWEVPDAADPWSHIGYWGDHQVIYLLKLLEILRRHQPDVLRDFLTREIFCYANVPYRLKAYEELVKNPKETVTFDVEAEQLVQRRVREKGSDGKLLWDQRGQVQHVNLTEKLLVSLLAKLSNFIPDGGIWLNTQRPEWNDANNALVGNGVSMVTVYYLRRYLVFCHDTFSTLEKAEVRVSESVAELLNAVCLILKRHLPQLSRRPAAALRRRVLDGLGRAGAQYRKQLYSGGLSERKMSVSVSGLLDFFETALGFVDHAIRANRRADGLYHAYNLVAFEKKNELQIRPLYEMLEGQVAVLSSESLSPEETLELLRSMKRSALYRADQQSYLLYPDRRLPHFIERNNIPSKLIKRCRLFQRLATDGNRLLVERDITGNLHFNGAIMNQADVSRLLDKLAAGGYRRLVAKERRLVLEIFGEIFEHRAFTGRSGTFFGYEGLGCVYWHMVSKLLLAVQEAFFRAACAGARTAILTALAASYYDIREGIGDRKTPKEWGAFPMDPYSHTPGQGGARQPGLTGQVKEDILCRQGELGLFVEEDAIRFRPWLLKQDEFLNQPTDFKYFDVRERERALALPAGSLAFTYCQVPIVYRLATRHSLLVVMSDGTQETGAALSPGRSVRGAIFQRNGKVRRIEVGLRFRKDGYPDAAAGALSGPGTRHG